jgi:glycosyltransferase involved in cell wall biosynthesis
VQLATFIHDVVQDHYDTKYPDAVKPLEAAYFRASFKASVRDAKIIFTPTEFSRAEVQHVAHKYGCPTPQIVCCGEGFETPTEIPMEQRRDIIANAHPFPQKLTRYTVEYMSRWSKENSFAESVHWVGLMPPDLKSPELPGWKPRGRVPELEYRALMRQARVHLYFSDYEGFGRPPVEAILAGAAPVFSDIPATREVMGDCGFPFKNGDYESFTAALRKALAATPEQIKAWAEILLTRHNWTSVADRIVTALAASGSGQSTVA